MVMSGGNLKLKNKRLKKVYSTLKLGFFLALVAGLLFIACFGQYIVPYDPYAQDLNNALHWERIVMAEICSHALLLVPKLQFFQLWHW